jgi:hypothetical protein
MRQGRDATLALLALGIAATAAYFALRRRGQQAPRPVFDYSDRSGFPRPPHEMRGIAHNRGQSPVSSLAISP